MGGRGSRSRLNPYTSSNTVSLPQTATQTQQMTVQLQNVAQQQATATTDDDYHIATAQDEAAIMAVNAAYDRAMRAAQMDYISPTQQANGYAFSQNMNHDLVLNGANEK